MFDDIIAYVSIKTVCLAIIVAYGLVTISKWISDERKIRTLGGHAPKIPSYLPFGMPSLKLYRQDLLTVLGLDMVIGSVRSTMHHKNLETWQSWLKNDKIFGQTVEGTPAGLRCIFTADPENIKAILATQFQDYGKGVPFHEDWNDFLGDGIFAADNQPWHDSRQLLRPQFIKDRVSDLETFEKHVQVLMRAVANGGVEGAPGVATDGVGRGREVDVSDLFFRYTLDAATDFLLGRSVGSLEVPRQDFAVAFGEVQRVQNIIARAGYVLNLRQIHKRLTICRPLNRLVPRKTFYAGLKVINEFVNPYIEQALRLSPEELETRTKSESGYTFLHALAAYTRDRKVLRDQLVSMLLAGRDTTASTLSWTFYELAKHPEVFQRLRAEIMDTVGLDRPPTYNDLKSMKYLQVNSLSTNIYKFLE
jgi:cytochrome P450